MGSTEQGGDAVFEAERPRLVAIASRVLGDPVEAEDVEPGDHLDAAPDPAEDVVLADTVAVALQVVLDRLTPSERVAFVLHDSFGVEHATIAGVLGTTPGTR